MQILLLAIRGERQDLYQYHGKLFKYQPWHGIRDTCNMRELSLGHCASVAVQRLSRAGPNKWGRQDSSAWPDILTCIVRDNTPFTAVRAVCYVYWACWRRDDDSFVIYCAVPLFHKINRNNRSGLLAQWLRSCIYIGKSKVQQPPYSCSTLEQGTSPQLLPQYPRAIIISIHPHH